MKKIVYTALSIFIVHAQNPTFSATPPAQTSLPQAHSKVVSYLGIIQFPGQERQPTTTVYHKGTLIPCSHGAYILNKDKKVDHLLLVIARLEKPTANTIAHFMIPDGARYDSYFLTRIPVQTEKKDSFEETWKLAKKEGKGPWAVPEEALVIFMDPTCIEKVTPSPWSKESLFIQLPTIIFKKGATSSGQYNRAVLASLDVKPFHKPTQTTSSQQTKTSTSSREDVIA